MVWNYHLCVCVEKVTRVHLEILQKIKDMLIEKKEI
jgi:hypothetical protein